MYGGQVRYSTFFRVSGGVGEMSTVRFQIGLWSDIKTKTNLALSTDQTASITFSHHLLNCTATTLHSDKLSQSDVMK